MARTQNLSDSTEAIVSKVTAQTSLYSDVDLAFKAHPNTGDITTLRDIDSIKQSVKNLILTNPGERPFAPTLGSRVRGLLFEPVDPFTSIELQEAIKEVLLNFEPRIIVNSVDVKDDADNNRYSISISYRIVTTLDTGDITFYLERIR